MVEKNQLIELTIVDLGHSGEGIGKIDGFTVFVEGALPGDRIQAQIILVKKNYAVGKLKTFIEASPDRVEPRCPLADRCGGCQIMHLNYPAQLRLKQSRVEENLKRIGKLDVPVNPVLGMDTPYEYRNKAQFPVGVVSGQAVMGFFQKGSHQIVDTAYCHIQHATHNQLLLIIKQFLQEKSIPIYDEQTKKGLLRHVVTKVGHHTGQVMVVLVVNGTSLPHEKELVALLKEQVAGLTSVVLNSNMKNTNVILGRENKILYGQETIEDRIGSLKFKISPHSFFQVNSLQTEVLYGKALEYAALQGDETVFDIYCGIGTISLFLAQKSKKVYGIEVVEAAIEDAKKNAELNGLENTEFYTGEAERVVPELYKKGIRADVVVVDPPRKGCEPIVLETIAGMAPKRIVYVSCNPATLARDLAILEELGYQTQQVQPVDLFPMTVHCEVVVLLQRLEA